MNTKELRALIQRALSEPTAIRNWTHFSGYIGEDFEAQAGPAGVTCFLPQERYVPMEEIEQVYLRWEPYCKGDIPRYEIRDITKHSKYAISILHQLLQEDQRQTL